ncbi:glycosyltransferase involved in cell wall biosynthesis [Thermonema lapsum]|uniref:Glycosyltransferase involved in cell wall biosynthesis n=1 Tax=Thermonema lapsum TaxID=28195 RepID=A0A846MMC5_9BACT|nr:glycosyltransferase family 2 protein [Thermonema lapsum]NIK72621.1 glycosyltransferase involved in cell wall biosynthesis [Thermonema lapsum]
MSSIPQASLDLSIVIPAYNEAESLPELIEWISRVLSAYNWKYEIIVIDDGSEDQTAQVLHTLKKQYPALRAIRFLRNYGKSAALQSGFEAARGAVVITMDADLQDDPEEIPALYRMIRQEGYDLVSGWKYKRYDPLSKTLPSKLFNAVTRKLSGIPLHDFNCGLKAYRFEVVKSIEVYGEMHRYLPVIAKWAGFKRIGEKKVKHHPRRYGKTKFGIERFLFGFLDLLSIQFVSRFRKRPMHFFGGLGVLSFTIGAFITLWLIVYKLWALAHGLPYREVSEQPLFYLALTSIIIGFQLFLTGFLGEMVVSTVPKRHDYIIAETID